jgi:hypothetical protein
MLGMSWLGDKSIGTPAFSTEQDITPITRMGGGTDKPLSSPLSTLRLRWRWVAGAFLLGLLGGGLTTGPTGYDATAILEVTQTSADSARIKQLGQTVESTATSSVVVAEAARRRGLSPTGLASRLKVVWKEDTDVVDITVRAANPRAAALQANAVATAVSTVAERQSASQVDQISRAGDDLLSSGELSDRKAEATRKTELGSAVATQQSDAVANSTAVQLVGPARTAKASGIPRPVGAALGGFGLAALAAAFAVFVPFRRRRVRGVEELESLMPGVRVRPVRTAPGEVAGLILESGRRDLAVVTMDDPGSAHEFANEVMELLAVHGVPSSISSVEEQRVSRPLTPAAIGDGVRVPLGPVGPTGRREARREPDAPVRVMVTGPDERALSLLDGQSQVLAVIVVAARRHRVGELQQVAARLQYADPTVILTS